MNIFLFFFSRCPILIFFHAAIAVKLGKYPRIIFKIIHATLRPKIQTNTSNSKLTLICARVWLWKAERRKQNLSIKFCLTSCDDDLWTYFLEFKLRSWMTGSRKCSTSSSSLSLFLNFTFFPRWQIVIDFKKFFWKVIGKLELFLLTSRKSFMKNEKASFLYLLAMLSVS